MILLPLLGLVLIDAAVWVIAFRLQQPDETATGTWAQIDRNMRIIGANVAVIGVNVALFAVVVVVKAVLRG